MEDQQKTTTEDASEPVDQELKTEELDELAGGTGGGSGGPPTPHH